MLAQIVHEPATHEPFLSFTSFVKSRLSLEKDNLGPLDVENEHEDFLVEESGPFWGMQICCVGTVFPRLKKVRTDAGQAIFACCDRPVVFYESNDSLEMHYLTFN